MATVAEVFNLAWQHHQAGNFPFAEQLYRHILQTDPSHADSWCFLGAACQAQGKQPEAEDHFRRAIHVYPDHANAHNYLGVLLAQQGRLDEAAVCFGRAVQVQPDNADSLNNLGIILDLQGKFADAVAQFQQALRYRPGLVAGYYNQGIALRKLGKPDDAIACFEHAIQLQPNHVDAHTNLGIVLLEQRRLDQAEVVCREAMRLDPNHAGVHTNLGNVLKSQKKPEQALHHYRTAVRLNPHFAPAHNGLGNVLADLEQYDEAARCLEESIQLQPGFAEGHHNLGVVRQAQCRFGDALTSFGRAIKLDAGNAEMHYSRAMLHLLMGHWKQAWPEFEWRLKTEGYSGFPFTQPRWDGSPLAGRTLLLVPEQGLGDALLLIRYVPLLRQMDGQVMVQCRPALHCLLSGCYAQRNLIAPGEPLPHFDVYAPVLSLPGLLGTTPTNVPGPVPYLHADATLVERWRSELESQAGGAGAFKVGIVWQGNRDYKSDRTRSIPLKHFARLGEVDGVQLISLQKGLGTEQMGSFQLSPISYQPEALDEASGAFMDTAAIIANLDLVISSDTAVPHLAGALGAAVWLALPHVPDWRWLLEQEDTPWYPTMRLFRQTRPGCWDDVFERMAAELQKRGRGYFLDEV